MASTWLSGSNQDLDCSQFSLSGWCLEEEVVVAAAEDDVRPLIITPRAPAMQQLYQPKTSGDAWKGRGGRVKDWRRREKQRGQGMRSKRGGRKKTCWDKQSNSLQYKQRKQVYRSGAYCWRLSWSRRRLEANYMWIKNRSGKLISVMRNKHWAATKIHEGHTAFSPGEAGQFNNQMFCWSSSIVWESFGLGADVF